MDYQAWLKFQHDQSITRLFANISPWDAVPGVVIASPERNSPNYYFHWVRDAALTMDLVTSLYLDSQGSRRQSLREKLMEYARFSRRNQLSPTRSGIGEPKFNVDGTGYGLDWCRPQNDGPALRALTLIRFANDLLDHGEVDLVRSSLYGAQLPANTVVKADLEYVSHHWKDMNCEIWEEVQGDHFYTRLVQKSALMAGSLLARRLGDVAASAWYESRAHMIQPELFWDQSKGVFVPSLNVKGETKNKSSGLDSQVVLAILHAGSQSGISVADARVMDTVRTLKDRFASLYSINRIPGAAGVAIGRYPEDIYDGGDWKGGNPWVLITAAFASMHYLQAAELAEQGRLAKARAHFNEGDLFLKRLQYHANPDGSLSEQFHRDTGFMMSARDLTWSHAEFVQAVRHRRASRKLLAAPGE